MERDKLLENPKVTAKRRYTEHELRKLLKGYCKSHYNAVSLIDKVDTAIRNVKAFCSDIQQLKDEAGANLGDLIMDLREGE